MEPKHYKDNCGRKLLLSESAELNLRVVGVLRYVSPCW